MIDGAAIGGKTACSRASTHAILAGSGALRASSLDQCQASRGNSMVLGTRPDVVRGGTHRPHGPPRGEATRWPAEARAR